MKASKLQSELVNWTVRNSGFEARRPYIGLSHMGECDRLIYDQYVYGFERPKVAGHLQTRWSYEVEQIIIARLTEMKLFTPMEEISLFDGLVKGHPDGGVCGSLLEIKSVQREDHFPKEGRIPRRVFWQVQAYLRYTGIRWCDVIYVARDTGILQVYEIKEQPNVGDEIDCRLADLVKAVQTMTRPACSCGRCLEASPDGHKSSE